MPVIHSGPWHPRWQRCDRWHVAWASVSTGPTINSLYRAAVSFNLQHSSGCISKTIIGWGILVERTWVRSVNVWLYYDSFSPQELIFKQNLRNEHNGITVPASDRKTSLRMPILSTCILTRASSKSDFERLCLRQWCVLRIRVEISWVLIVLLSKDENILGICYPNWKSINKHPIDYPFFGTLIFVFCKTAICAQNSWSICSRILPSAEFVNEKKICWFSIWYIWSKPAMW